MEEAWEFAVVSGQDDDELKFDWPSRHTRLTFQASISSLIALYLTLNEGASIDFPFIAEGQKNFVYYQVDFLHLGVFVFAVYSLVSFYLYSEKYKAIRPSVREQLVTALSNLENSIDIYNDSIGRIDLKKIPEKLEGVVVPEELLGGVLKSVNGKINTAASQFRDEVTKFNSALERASKSGENSIEVKVAAGLMDENLHNISTDVQKIVSNTIVDPGEFIPTLGPVFDVYTDAEKKVTEQVSLLLERLPNEKDSLVKDTERLVSVLANALNQIDNSDSRMAFYDKYWSYKIPLWFSAIILFAVLALEFVKVFSFLVSMIPNAL